jgi:hypothetical protein
MENAAWREVESKVHCPSRWLMLSIGGVFLIAGVGWYLGAGGVAAPGVPPWTMRLCASLFALLGAVVLASTLGSLMRPGCVRHAAGDVAPGVPSEPLICEGWTLHGGVTHELVRTDEGWEFRPAENLWRDGKCFLLGFGVPFIAVFAGLLAWGFRHQFKLGGWRVAIFGGAAVAIVCGGSALALMGMVIRASYRRLCRLNIPDDGGELELDLPEEPNPDEIDLNAGLKWVLLGETERWRLTIPREFVKAVQLCPWKYVVEGLDEKSVSWAVQGLLVLSSQAAAYHRLPILLTGDFLGGARLMQRLAITLAVPYLFHADKEGWHAESQRAKTRPSLRIGAMQG